MTSKAKAKAKDLIRSFSFICYDQEQGVEIHNPTLREAAKQCALIACDFAMEVMIENLVPIEIDELKQEIQKL